ncbi:uncharacterized protein LOC133802666 isoform X2 [Humulus lupulus]|uniref:uncharacterized protein LOC133802666 isoform X2 n=1 Tax=Humulus lupulus TaxID=3486 RepID=UPI002B4045E0|nr:uncharacterized protein LOC133802666 isoform X2 [Humulus lupulus]
MGVEDIESGVTQGLLEDAAEIEIGILSKEKSMNDTDLKETLDQRHRPLHHLLEDSKEARQEYLQTVPPLNKAVLKNDIKTVLRIIKKDSRLLRTAITRAEETILHVAAGAKNLHLVKELVNLMEEDDLALQDCKGNTAFCYATITGSIDIAIILMNKNKNLPLVRGGQGMTPLYMATLFGHSKMSWFLYPITKKILEQGEWMGIFFTCIHSDLYGLALRMLEEDSELAIARDVNNDTALHILARKTYVFCHQTPRLWKWKSSNDNNSSLLPWFKKSLNKENQALQLVRGLWNEILVRLPNLEVNKLINRPSSLLFEAAELGNFHFLIELIRAQPDLVWDVDEKNRTIFHIAVLNRHSNIFNLIHEIGSIKDVIITFQDDDNNNILHLAATLPPSHKFNEKFGGALKMQQELSWFKEVQKFMLPSYAHMKNSEGLTPKEVFNTEHASLLKEGDRWMKSTSKSCLMVSILIFVGVLITASRAPYYDNEGRNSNRLNSVALSSSFFSTLTFLSIITSSYPKVEVLVSLPFKLIMGLATLFISLTTMLAAFNGEHASLLKEGDRWMKSTSKSCLMVSILIFVGVLITASRAPYYDNEGRNSNRLNSVALSSSFFSTLTFLSIITSSYPKVEVLVSLPFKLIMGLATLFISLTTMLAAFNGG